jgi:Tfp pilus assembly protein PilF
MFIGELHRLRADTAKAIERFRKALEKDPNNQAAKARLAMLGVKS